MRALGMGGYGGDGVGGTRRDRGGREVHPTQSMKESAIGKPVTLYVNLKTCYEIFFFPCWWV